MSLTYGFYNSVNHDRPYNTTQISKLFDGLILDGIFMAIGTRMVVKATTGMGFKVGVGRAWFNHTWTDNDADLPMTLEASDVLLDRFDAVVLEVDSSDPVRANTIKIIKGTPASTPVKPSLTNTEFVHQYPLCYITVGKNITEITDAVIENKVGTSDCPFATGVIQGMNIDDLIAQWNSEFDAWFQRMKDQLSTDAAGNLQSQIDAHLANKNNPHAVTPEQIKAPYYWVDAFTDEMLNDPVTPYDIHGVATPTNVSTPYSTYWNIWKSRWSQSTNHPFERAVNIWDGSEYTRQYCTSGWSAWEQKAGGNQKVWIATAVTMSTDNLAVMITVPNFTFTEGCKVSFLAPVAPLSNPWMQLQINGTILFFFRRLDHNNLDGDEWVANTQVEVSLSSISIPNGNGSSAGAAFFKGGASVKELYDFPLSMQTAAPTPVNTNHIWIVNDTKMNFTFDEAIRSGDWSNDNRYYGLVDSTDNNYLFYESAKKTTDGAAVLCTNRHMARDTAPLHLGYSTFSKKYGLPCTSDNWSKWPRIYSRIGGIVDIETAMRWDGSAWQYLSQKGHYVLAMGNYTGAIWNRAGAALTSHVNQMPSTTSDEKMAATKDGMYVAASCGLDLYVYKRVGDSFNNISHLQTSQAIFQLSFSPDGVYLAVAASFQILIYKKQADGTFALLVDLGNMGLPHGAVHAVCWSPDGSRVMCSDNYSCISIYNRSVDSFTLRAKMSSGIYGNADVFDLEWIEENTASFQTNNNGQTVISFNPNGLYFYKSYPSTLSGTMYQMHPVAALSSRKLIFRQMDASTTLQIWSIDNSDIPLFSLNLGEYIYSCFQSPDEKYVFVICQYSIKAVAINADFSLSLVGSTAISDSSLFNLIVT